MSSHEAGVALFCFCLVLNWTSSMSHWLSPDRMRYSYGIGAQALPAERWRIVVAAVLTAMFVAMVWLWARGGAEVTAGLGVLAMVGGLRILEQRNWDGDQVVGLGKYVPSAASLAGWLIGWQLWGDAPGRERAAWEAACGIPAGAMTMAGIQKFIADGWGWFTPRGLNLMLAERSVLGPLWQRALRRAFVARPRLTAWLGGAVVAGELAGVLVAFPATRAPATGAMMVTVVGFMLLLGYWEFEWMLLYLALCLASLGLPWPS